MKSPHHNGFAVRISYLVKDTCSWSSGISPKLWGRGVYGRLSCSPASRVCGEGREEADNNNGRSGEA